MTKIYNSREIIRMLVDDGWVEVRVTGSHHHFKHPRKQGVVTVPHPKKQIGRGLFGSILKQALLRGE
jgi:predicted RNA binding protein YcfA (HicA-like mRNA interferase family)